jgi:hypothetical protein
VELIAKSALFGNRYNDLQHAPRKGQTIMKRTTKILGSTSGLLAIAAFSGMINGASLRAAAASTSIHHSAKTTIAAKAGVSARNLDDQAGKHDCAGKNDCKGQGGCKSSDNGCKGKNSCKGKGGCNTGTM